MPSDYRFEDIPIERKLIILAVVLFFNLIVISSQMMLKNNQSVLQNLLGSVVSPFQFGVQRSTDFVADKWNHYLFLKNLYPKYLRLQKKYLQLQEQDYQLKKAIGDYAFLERVKSRVSNFRMANVVGIDSNFQFNQITIDLGRQASIREGAAVLNEDGELVGKVVPPIAAFTAMVRLITSKIGGVGAYVESNMLEGLLTGNNTSTCNFKYLIENKPVKLDETIVSSGTDLIFPPYIPIGRIVKIERDFLMLKITVKPFFTEKSIKRLIVFTND
jgi:rod shape-determining protein MreC